MLLKRFTARYDSDVVGILSGSLCLIHCIITPVIFMSQLFSTAYGNEAPLWWGTVDILFLIVSFIAIYYTITNTNRQWVTYMFWTCWLLQSLVIINEHVEWFTIWTGYNYLPAVGLIGMHIYHKRYRKCSQAKIACPADNMNETQVDLTLNSSTDEQ